MKADVEGRGIFAVDDRFKTVNVYLFQLTLRLILDFDTKINLFSKDSNKNSIKKQASKHTSCHCRLIC